MKNILQRLFLVALTVLCAYSVSADSEPMKYLLISSGEPSTSQLINIENVGKITFDKVDGRFVMNIGSKQYDLEENKYVNLTQIHYKYTETELIIKPEDCEHHPDRTWWIDSPKDMDIDLEVKSVLPDWISCAFEGISIILTLRDNETDQDRETNVEVGYKGDSETASIHVVQQAHSSVAASYLKFDKTELIIDKDAYSEKFGRNDDWTFKLVNTYWDEIPLEFKSELPDWIQGRFDGRNVILTIRGNKSDTPRDAYIGVGFQGYEHIETLHIHQDANAYGKIPFNTTDLYVDKGGNDWWIHTTDILWGDEEVLKLKNTLPDWIELVKTEAGLVRFIVAENNTDEPREADLLFGLDGSDYEGNIHVFQQSEYLITDEMQESGFILFQTGPPNYVQPQGDTFVFHFLKGTPFRLHYTHQYVKTPQERDLEENEKIPFKVDINETEGTAAFIIGENTGATTSLDTEVYVGSHKIEIRFVVMAKGKPSFAEQKQALIDFYQATNGDNWGYHENWLSDKPLTQWHGIEIRGRYITHIYLKQNGIVGEIPNEAMKVLIQTPVHFEMDQNGLYGRLSDELQELPDWQTSGLSLMCQSPYASSQRRLTNYKCNLRVPDENVEYLDETKGTSTLYEILSHHKLNHIMIGGPDEFNANMQLSYPGAFQNIVTAFDYFEDRETMKGNANKHPFKEHTIHLFRALQSNIISSVIGSSILVDDQGYIVEVLIRDWGVEDTYYHGVVEDVARTRLGEPTPHEWFKFPDEENNEQDMRNDGKYKCLHRATVDKGIDIVLMGDGFDASHNEEDGQYEQLMNQAMESIMSMEPLNSLRDRINVYMIHVVSQSTNVGDGKTALNYDDEKCREYAAKIPDIDMEHVTIVNIANRLEWEGSSYTNIHNEGWSVAHIVNGGVSMIMNHEVCGHGIGRFLDEYILAGYQNNHVSPDDYSDFCAFIDLQHSLGIGLNVDYHSNPKEILWSMMLEDPRYDGLVGMYQGADRYPYDLWRSTENSLMGTANSTMSAVQRMIVYKRIMSLTQPDWEFDYETFVEFDSKNR